MKKVIHDALAGLMPKLHMVQAAIEGAEEGWTENYDRNDPQDQYLRKEYGAIGERIDDIRTAFDLLNAQVVAEGQLAKNGLGRYEVGGFELNSGSRVEYLQRGEHGWPDMWRASRIEHNGDYYIVAEPELPLAGVLVRVKRVKRFG